MGKAASGSPRRRRKRRGRRLTRAIAGVALAAIAIRLFALQGYRVSSRSMEDSLLLGDRILLDTISYGIRIPFTDWRLLWLRPPVAGDVVVHVVPDDPSRTVVRRCVAVAGQTVEMRDKMVFVDGERLSDPPFSKYVDARIIPAGPNGRDNLGPLQIQDGHIFVMGDNRDNSRDSRHWGPLPVGRVIGRGLWVYWSSTAPADRAAEGQLTAGTGEVDQSLFQRVRWSRIGRTVP